MAWRSWDDNQTDMEKFMFYSVYYLLLVLSN
jgi:hypothetical protein